MNQLRQRRNFRAGRGSHRPGAVARIPLRDRAFRVRVGVEHGARKVGRSERGDAREASQRPGETPAYSRRAPQ